MTTKPLKKNSILLSIVVIAFIVAAVIFYFFFIYIPKSTHASISFDDLPAGFAEKVYPGYSDLGKYFLTILVGVFVASITFSEKIVNFTTSSPWAKSLLILCWILLLVSIVCDGMGLVFLGTWYAGENIQHQQSNVDFLDNALICYFFAGISFGLSLTSMLTAGLISFATQFGWLSQSKTQL